MSAEPCGPREAGCASLSEGGLQLGTCLTEVLSRGRRVGSSRGETAQGFRAVRRAGGTARGGPQPSPWAGVCGELGGVEAGGLGAQLPPWPGLDGAQERM